MLTNEQYIALSLELNLFFLRIAKEHAIFLEAGFPSKYGALIHGAEMNKLSASRLLLETIGLANANIGQDAVNSGEFVTELTLEAEKKTQQLTGVMIDSNLTNMELSLRAGIPKATQAMLQNVSALNQRAYAAASASLQYVDRVYAEDTACRIFNYMYPLNIDHVGRETRQYIDLLGKVQKRDNLSVIINAAEELLFWNRIMEEHAEFIRGLLDPSEKQLFDKANLFAREFEQLVRASQGLSGNPGMTNRVTRLSINDTEQLRSFKRQGEAGILSCSVRSLISPLMADHVLREANHYLRVLNLILTLPATGQPLY